MYSQLFCTPPINVPEYEDDAIEAEENENVEEIEEKAKSSQSSNNASTFTTALHILCNEIYTLRMLSQNCAKFMALLAPVPLHILDIEVCKTQVLTIIDGAGKTRGIVINVCGKKDLAYLAT